MPQADLQSGQCSSRSTILAVHASSEHDPSSDLLFCRCLTQLYVCYAAMKLSAAVSLLYIFQLLPAVDLAGQDSQPEWAHSAAGHPPGQAWIHSPDRHLGAAVSCLGGAGSQPEAGGRCAGHDLAAPPDHCCSCTLLQGQHLLHHLPACRSACCAVTCQAVPSRVVPSCAAPCYAVLCCAMLCCAPPCCAAAYYAVMCCVRLCCTFCAV